MTLSEQHNVYSQLECTYSKQSIEDSLQDEQLLAVIGFDDQCRPTQQARHFTTGLPRLDNHSPTTEIWRTNTPVIAGIDEDIYWSKCKDYQFTCLWVNEQNYPSLENATYAAYIKLLNFVEQSGYPYLVRAWNYLSHINLGSDDKERYKQFCIGRAQAFQALSNTRYPAATAVGHQSENLVVYLLSSTQTVDYFENPRQIKAYHYPRQYGPSSPSFSRASCIKPDPLTLHFISGTASIIGHESKNIDDLAGQITTTHSNINLLTQQIGQKRGYHSPPLPSMLKIYLRNADQFESAQTLVKRYFGEHLPALYLQGDICRRELLIEIDGLCQFQS